MPMKSIHHPTIKRKPQVYLPESTQKTVWDRTATALRRAVSVLLVFFLNHDHFAKDSFFLKRKTFLKFVKRLNQLKNCVTSSLIRHVWKLQSTALVLVKFWWKNRRFTSRQICALRSVNAVCFWHWAFDFNFDELHC